MKEIIIASIPGLLSLLTVLFTTLYKGRKDDRKAMRCLLKHQLREIYNSVRDKEQISYEEFKDADDTYQAYHSYGGNGSGTKLYEEICKKEVI